MEYTTNYNLKKPGDQDNVLVGDLNENMDTVDATMKELSDGKANLDPDTGKVPDNELPDDLFLKLIGGTMKGAIAMGGFPVSGLVDPVEDDHATRKGYVDAALTKRPIVAIGSYVGNGSTAWRSIAVGFKPDAVLLFAAGAAYTAAPTYFATAGSITMSLFEITSNGFRIKNGTYGNSPYYFMNADGMNYDYIALKFI